MATLDQVRWPPLNLIPSLMLPASPPLSRENGNEAGMQGHVLWHSHLAFNNLWFMHFFKPEFFSVSFYCFSLNTSSVFPYFKFSIIDLNIHSKDLNKLKSSAYACSTSLYKERGWARLSLRHWIMWNRIPFIWTSSVSLYCSISISSDSVTISRL